jgi:hypothetical protein
LGWIGIIKHPNIDRAVRHRGGKARVRGGRNQISRKPVALSQWGSVGLSKREFDEIITPRSYYTRPVRVAFGEGHDKGDVLISAHTVCEGAYPISSIRAYRLVL